MANAYHDTSTQTALFLTAYDRAMRLALRGVPTFREIADTKPANTTNPGSVTTFTFYSDLATQTSALTETASPESVAIANPSTVQVTANEYGGWIQRTRKYDVFNLDPKNVQNLGNILAFNQVQSVNEMVGATLVLPTASARVLRAQSGSFVASAAANNNAITSADKISGSGIRYVVSKLRAANVVPSRGSLYRVDIHPEVSHDLRAETGAASWRQPNEYGGQTTGSLATAEMGIWEGAYFVETSYMPNDTSGATATSTRVFNTFVTGKEALAEAVAEEFHPVLDGTIVDPLNRFTPLGWFGIAGWGRFRPDSLWNIRTTSSIHNT